CTTHVPVDVEITRRALAEPSKSPSIRKDHS
ncbi:transcriptional regulator, partial [Vibrio agarivorans]